MRGNIEKRIIGDHTSCNACNRRNLTDADIMRITGMLNERRAKGGDRGNQYTGGKVAMPSVEGIAKGRSGSAKEHATLIGTSATKVEKARTTIAHGTVYLANF